MINCRALVVLDRKSICMINIYKGTGTCKCKLPAHSKCDKTQHWLTEDRESFQIDEVKVPLLALIKPL